MNARQAREMARLCFEWAGYVGSLRVGIDVAGGGMGYTARGRLQECLRAAGNALLALDPANGAGPVSSKGLEALREIAVDVVLADDLDERNEIAALWQVVRRHTAIAKEGLA